MKTKKNTTKKRASARPVKRKTATAPKSETKKTRPRTTEPRKEEQVVFESGIVMTWPDHARLSAMVEARRGDRNGPDFKAFERLAAELARAQLVAAQDIPADIVTMDTKVKVQDLDSREIFSFVLSWPERADAADNRINVLAPLGMALLGCRVGQEIKWPVPDGFRRFRIKSVLLQPESESIRNP